MKNVFLFLFLISLNGCIEVLEHSNPVDPKNSIYSSTGKNANIKIIGSSIEKAVTFPSIEYNLSIRIKNLGTGPTNGPLYGSLSTKENDFSFLSPYYSGATFKSTTNNEINVYRNDELNAIYRLSVPQDRVKPFDSKFYLTVNDGYSNKYLDSLVVTISN